MTGAVFSPSDQMSGASLPGCAVPGKRNPTGRNRNGTMRVLVVLLALLVALKVWAQDHTYRFAANEALIAAYRTRAAAACTASSQLAAAAQPGRAITWTDAEEPRVVIGKAGLPVHFWEIDHELWDARFRHAYLVLGGAGGATCTYDMLADTAEISSS